MEDFNTDWTHQELKAFMLLYCASADFVITEEEKKFIKSKVNEADYQRIHSEFENDNDYQRIQKIHATIERLEYSKEEIDEAFQSIKDLFLTDGEEIDILEQNLYRGLKHLLRQ
jgi:archaellum component FlaC